MVHSYSIENSEQQIDVATTPRSHVILDSKLSNSTDSISAQNTLDNLKNPSSVHKFSILDPDVDRVVESIFQEVKAYLNFKSSIDESKRDAQLRFKESANRHEEITSLNGFVNFTIENWYSFGGVFGIGYLLKRAYLSHTLDQDLTKLHKAEEVSKLADAKRDILLGEAYSKLLSTFEGQLLAEHTTIPRQLRNASIPVCKQDEILAWDSFCSALKLNSSVRHSEVELREISPRIMQIENAYDTMRIQYLGSGKVDMRINSIRIGDSYTDDALIVINKFMKNIDWAPSFRSAQSYPEPLIVYRLDQKEYPPCLQ